jgi:pyruvate flavodoxin/ferredoxin oxidoreductase-like protein
MALVAQAAAMRTRIPVLHFFDGFRTSHELNTIEMLSDDDLRALVPEELVRAHRLRSLSPERPFIRGTAQNPDVYLQARETVNSFYASTPRVVEQVIAELGERTGRRYGLVDFVGDPDAERVLVLMGSGARGCRRGRWAGAGGGAWCGGQVPAVDGRAAGGVGDLRPVAEQLRDQLRGRWGCSRPGCGSVIASFSAALARARTG